MIQARSCDHVRSTITTDARMLVDQRPPRLIVDVRIVCADCRKRFMPLGVRHGVSITKPSARLDGEVSIPFEVER